MLYWISLGIIAFIAITLIIVGALSMGIVQEGYAVVITHLGKTLYYKTSGFYRLVPFVEDCKVVNWTLSNCDSGAIKNASFTGNVVKLSSCYIPLHVIVHDIDSVSCVTQDAITIDVDLRFTSQIVDPVAAVSPDAPKDLWNYVENFFETTLTDYVRTKTSMTFSPNHIDKNELISYLANTVNAHCALYGIKIVTITVQDLRFSEAIIKVQEEKKQTTLESELKTLQMEQELMIQRMKTNMELERLDKMAEMDAQVIRRLISAGLSSSDVVQYMALPKLGDKNPIMFNVGGAFSRPLGGYKNE